MNKRFLPASLDEGKKYYENFSQFDVVFVTGDPYYDPPLSGVAVISRLLDKKGCKIGIIAQPVSDEDYKICGKPKYFFALHPDCWIQCLQIAPLRLREGKISWFLKGC